MSDTDTDLLRTLIDWRRAGNGVQLVTVAATFGSSPRPPGAMAIVRDDGAVAGSVSGGCVESRLVQARRDAGIGHDTFTVTDEQARRAGLTCGGRLELIFEAIDDVEPFERLLEALASRRRMLREYDLGTGSARVVEAQAGDAFAWTGRVLRRPFGPGWRVLLIGAGELSVHVARLAGTLDFDVIVCEPRAAFQTAFDVDGARLVDALPDDAVQAHANDERSAVLALSHDPTLDDLALEQALVGECFYIGALGSRRSHARRRQRLTAWGVPAARLDRIHAPIGLDIGSRTSAEIAVSIAAELVAVRSAARPARTEPDRQPTPQSSPRGPDADNGTL